MDYKETQLLEKIANERNELESGLNSIKFYERLHDLISADPDFVVPMMFVGKTGKGNITLNFPKPMIVNYLSEIVRLKKLALKHLADTMEKYKAPEGIDEKWFEELRKNYLTPLAINNG